MSAHTFGQLYEKKAHAIQSGVAMEMGMADHVGSPEIARQVKHLRTGLNLAMCDHASLVRVLVGRGIITEEEYHTAVLKGLDEEIMRIEVVLSDRTGANIKLM